MCRSRCLLEEEETVGSGLETIDDQSVDTDDQIAQGDTVDITVMYSKDQNGIQSDEDCPFVLMIPQNKPDNPDARVYACRTCNLYNLSFAEFSLHISSHSLGNGEFGGEYESQDALHAAVARSINRTHVDCEVCESKCNSEASLLEHLETHTEEKTHMCNICAIGFTAEVSLRAHISLRHGLFCQDCDIQFDTAISLEEHMKNVHGTSHKKLITCETCGKLFPNKSSLRHHMIRHSDEQPYVCKTCNRAFKRTSSLYMHERAVHQKIKSFICVICNKKFALKTQMKTHMRVHTGERPYACDICGQTFKTTSQLQLHKDFHFDNRPFPCDYCDKKFRRRPNLILHLRTHTGEKPHLCDLCGRGFAQRGDMRKHKATHYKLKTTSTSTVYCQSTVSFMNNIRTPRSASFIDFRRAYQVLLQSYQRQVKPIDRSLPRNIKSNEWLEVVSLDIGNSGDSPITETHDKSQLSKPQSTTTIILQRSENDASNDENDSSDVINSSITTEESFIEPNLENNESMRDSNPSTQQNLSEECLKEEHFDSVASASAKTWYDCEQCKKKFRLLESFRAHMHVHSDTKRFTCHICGKQFGQTGSLYYHLKHVHGGVKQHACDLCGRSFAMKAAMEDHRRIHTGERPYCCASCGKTFKTKASLYIHSKTHTDELPHKCSYCPKAFRWRQQMLGHLTIHTGQKNHICEICGKRFGVKNDLTRHKRIHSEEKPFTCQQCGLCFGQKRYLKNHERTRHR